MDSSQMGKKGNQVVKEKYGTDVFSKGGKKTASRFKNMTKEQKKEYFRKVRAGISPLS